MNKHKIVLFGVSNILCDIYDCCMANQKRISKIILNAPEEKGPRDKGYEERLRELGEKPVVMQLSDFVPLDGEEYFVVPTTPKKSVLVDLLRKSFGLEFANLIHPTAYVSPYAKIGEGVFVGANSVIAPGAVLKDHVFINRGVTVGHDTVVGKYCRLQPGSNIGGLVEIGEGVMVGIGSSIIERLVIGRGAVVAAGSVVLNDVQERALVAGMPASVKRIYQE